MAGKKREAAGREERNIDTKKLLSSNHSSSVKLSCLIWILLLLFIFKDLFPRLIPSTFVEWVWKKRHFCFHLDALIWLVWEKARQTTRLSLPDDFSALLCSQEPWFFFPFSVSPQKHLKELLMCHHQRGRETRTRTHARVLKTRSEKWNGGGIFTEFHHPTAEEDKRRVKRGEMDG